MFYVTLQYDCLWFLLKKIIVKLIIMSLSLRPSLFYLICGADALKSAVVAIVVGWATFWSMHWSIVRCILLIFNQRNLLKSIRRALQYAFNAFLLLSAHLDQRRLTHNAQLYQQLVLHKLQFLVVVPRSDNNYQSC